MKDENLILSTHLLRKKINLHFFFGFRFCICQPKLLTRNPLLVILSGVVADFHKVDYQDWGLEDGGQGEGLGVGMV